MRAWCIVILVLVGVTFAAAPASAAGGEDDEPARDFHRPHDPKLMTAVTLGAAGYNHVNGGAAGGGSGAGGELGLRLDWEGSPLWLSAAGRVIVTRPSPLPLLELRAGYAFAFYDHHYLPERKERDRVRAFVRPFVGLRPMRYLAAGSPTRTVDVAPLEAGVDWSVILRKRPGENRVWRAYVVGMYDAVNRKAGIEVETTWGLGFSERSLGGPFIGARLGYLGGADSYGGVHIGAHWEL